MSKIIYYKSENGVYFADSSFGYSGRKVVQTDNRKFNGYEAQSTFRQEWFFIPSDDFNKVEKLIKGSRINKRYTLKDQDLANDKIPNRLSPEEVDEAYDDDDYFWYWRNKDYSQLRSLYEEEYDYTEDRWEEEEVELECLGEIEVQGEPEGLKVRVLNEPNWNHKGVRETDLSTIVRWDELHAMMTPELLIHTVPCSLTSRQTYEIIRQYVKDNIDPKLAVITSDYKFCFTVKKKIAIKPHIHKWEQKKSNGKSYARPRIKSKTVKYKEEEIFEMTNTEDGYKGYTPIEGFKGESLSDLIENLKLYLDELMTYINSPLKECECCNGTGHILK